MRVPPPPDHRVSRGPRIRTLKPDCWQDEALGECSRDARLLWVGLITQADDEGLQRGSMALLRSLIFPYDHGLPLDDVACWLAELVAAQLVIHYQVDGRSYIYLTGFTANQKIDKPSTSRWPAPPNSENDPRTVAERSRTVAPEGKGREGTTTSGNTSAAVVAPEAAAVLPPALADVMAIAQEAAGHRDTLNISAEAIALQLRNYPHANHLRAAHDAASDYMAGAVNTDLFHKWLGVKLAHQRPDQPDRRSERERREAEDVAALRALREAQA